MDEMPSCLLVNIFKAFEWNDLAIGICDIRHGLWCGNRTCVAHAGF